MDREKIIDRIHDAIDVGVCVDLFMDILELLKEHEAVVRCKDCKYGREPILAYRKGCVWCERVNRHNDADWFCADGERAE